MALQLQRDINGNTIISSISGNTQINGTISFTNQYPRWYIYASTAAGNATYNTNANNWGQSTGYASYFNAVQTGGSANSNAWSQTDGKFIAPQSGLYYFHVNMYINGSTASRWAEAKFFNSSNVEIGQQWFAYDNATLGSENVRSWDYIRFMNAGDKFYIHSYNGASVTLYLADGHTNYTIIKIA